MLRRMWRSTFGLVVLVAFGLAMATVGIGAIAYEITHEALEQQLDHRIEIETAALLAEKHEAGMAHLVDVINQREAGRTASSLDYLLLDQKGRRIAGAMTATPPAQGGYEELLAYRRGQVTGVAQSITTPIDGYRLVVAADRSGLNEIDDLLKALYAVGLIGMVAAGTIAAIVVGTITRRRLERIDGTAKAIIGGEFARRVPRDGSDSEFDQLAATLNQMLDRISGLMDNLRQVSSDVAHDLRTPLTRLLNGLDRALSEPDAASQREAIEAARCQASELLEIFAALLRITEIEGMAERLPRQRLNLSDLMQAMAETYLPDIEVSGHSLHSDIKAGLTVEGDRRLLNQAIANLLDNALRHTPPGTGVTLFGRQNGEHVEIGVADDAQGPVPADPSTLFRRFTRSEEARSTEGHGLGLALVAAVAAAHGGSAQILTDHGFTVQLRLPSA